MLRFFISLLFAFISVCSFAQEKQDVATRSKKWPAIRVGIDISKPIIGLIDKDNKALEAVVDYRLTKNLYVVAALGYADKFTEEDYFDFNTKGAYFKVGANYNVFKNWLGMENEIYVGLRYGYSAFTQMLNQYTVFQNGTYAPEYTEQVNLEFDDLNAHWAELVLGLQVQFLKNFYIGASVEFKKMITTKEPENFKNLYIPGFNRVYKNDTGIGFNYTLAYRILLF